MPNPENIYSYPSYNPELPPEPTTHSDPSATDTSGVSRQNAEQATNETKPAAHDRPTVDRALGSDDVSSALNPGLTTGATAATSERPETIRLEQGADGVYTTSEPPAHGINEGQSATGGSGAGQPPERGNAGSEDPGHGDGDKHDGNVRQTPNIGPDGETKPGSYWGWVGDHKIRTTAVVAGLATTLFVGSNELNNLAAPPKPPSSTQDGRIRDILRPEAVQAAEQMIEEAKDPKNGVKVTQDGEDSVKLRLGRDGFGPSKDGTADYLEGHTSEEIVIVDEPGITPGNVTSTPNAAAHVEEVFVQKADRHPNGDASHDEPYDADQEYMITGPIVTFERDSAAAKANSLPLDGPADIWSGGYKYQTDAPNLIAFDTKGYSSDINSAGTGEGHEFQGEPPQGDAPEKDAVGTAKKVAAQMQGALDEVNQGKSVS